MTDIFGEDVGPPLGGVFTATQGLKTAWNTPLDERGIIGMRDRPRARRAAAGRRDPVLRLHLQHHRPAQDRRQHLLVEQRRLERADGGDDARSARGIRGSIYHSHSFDATATHIPGWKIVMPSTPLDAYGLLLSALPGPEPGDVPRAEGAAPHEGRASRSPASPATTSVLSKMIDAPLGDRTQWKPQWPDAAAATPSRSARAKRVRAGTRRHRGHLRPHVPLCVDGRRGARGRGHRRRGHRPALALPLRLGGDQGELGEEDRPRALRERGHRGDELRRAPDPPHGGGALLRAARAAAAPRGRSSSRASASPTRSRWRACRSSATSPRRCGPWPASSPDGPAHFLECSPTMLPSVS